MPRCCKAGKGEPALPARASSRQVRRGPPDSLRGPNQTLGRESGPGAACGNVADSKVMSHLPVTSVWRRAGVARTLRGGQSSRAEPLLALLAACL